MAPAGARLAAKVTTAAGLGFVPVAVHFNLFQTLAKIGRPATAEELMKAVDEGRDDESKWRSPLCLRLTQDTMFIMAGLGFVDLIEDNVFSPNDITRHMIQVPSAPHGALHFTTEPLFGAAFLMRKLVDTNFEYPFRRKETPTQYGYDLMGEGKLSTEDTYSIMHLQGRMPSFDAFMEGKFGKFGTMPERVKSLGYDLDAAFSGGESSVAMVDIGGGRGEMLLEVKEAYPHLQPDSLILQDHYAGTRGVPGLTVMDWNFNSEAPQPVPGALNYSLTHIFHNLPDLDALQLMQKISKAMAPHSRLLIHEFPKNTNYGNMHAAMIEQFGGRERSGKEWKQMASMAGLKVTLEAYPAAGEGLVEMRRL